MGHRSSQQPQSASFCALNFGALSLTADSSSLLSQNASIWCRDTEPGYTPPFTIRSSNRQRLSVSNPRVRMRSRRRQSVGIVVAILLCIACSIAGIRLMPQRRYAHMIDLARALDRRPVEARIVGFPYSPYAAGRGTAPPNVLNNALVFRGAAGEFLLDSQTLSGHLHERAVASLVTANPKAAAELLEVAARQSPDDATILSDLSAARLAWGAIGDDMELFASALAAADAALRHNPESPEAGFNRA